MSHRPARTVELLPELTDPFTLGPGQARIVGVDHQHALLMPAGLLDFLGRHALAAEAFRDEPWRRDNADAGA